MTREELESLIYKADEAAQQGDAQAAEDVRYLLSELDKMDAGSPPQEDSSALDTFSDFGAGINQGLRNASQYGQDAVHRAGDYLGFEHSADALETLNRKKMRQAEANAERKERSPIAFGGGEMLGEAGFVAPMAGGGGAAVRGALSKAPALIKYLSGLATEGAIAGGFLTDGGAEERLTEAGKGAATDLVLGPISDGVTGFAGRKIRQLRAKDEVAEGVMDQVGEVDELVRKAADDGGFELDGATAMNTPEAQDVLTETRNSSDTSGMFADFKAQQEVDIKQKAASFGEEFGGLENLQRSDLNLKDVQTTLVSLKNADRAQVDNAYAAFREAAERAGYAPDRVTVKRVLQPLIDEFGDGGSAATRGLANDIASELRRYGVIGMRGEADKPLTFGNYEELIQDINDLYSPNLKAGEKRLLGRVKSALDDALDAAMISDGLPADAVVAGREARRLRHAFSENWTKNDIVGKLTEYKKDVPDEFKLDYTKMVQKLDRESVKKLKARLAFGEGKDSWRSLQQAPLLDAIAAATRDSSITTKAGNEVVFNDNAFHNALKKIPRDAQEALWGADFVKRLDDAQAAWRTRTRRIDTAGSPSTSGTGDFNYGLKVGRFAGSGPIRNIMMSLNAAFPQIKLGVRAGTREANAEAIMRGEVPKEIIEKWERDLLEEVEQRYLGTDKAKAMAAVQSATRVLLLASTNSETE